MSEKHEFNKIELRLLDIEVAILYAKCMILLLDYDSALYDLEEVDASIAISFSPSFAEEWRSLQRRNPSEKKAFKKSI
jgi:hypothetical protein